MDTIRIVYYEVFVLAPDGWDLHGRYPRDDRQIALTEAKRLEAELAAATKVVRSEYQPRGNHEDRREIYASRLTPTEHGHPMTPPPRPGGRRKGKRQRRHVVHRRDMTPGAVLVRLVGIVGASALLAALITAWGGTVLDETEMLSGLAAGSTGRGMVYGIFLAVFLLVALPWIVAFARQIEVISFATPPTPPSAKPARKRPKPAPEPEFASDGGFSDPMDTADLPPLPPAERLVGADIDDDPMPPPAPDGTPADNAGAAAEEPSLTAALAGVEPASLEPADPRDLGPKASERLLAGRRSLLRFLRVLVSDLRQTRPHLNSFERYGLGLLLAGAVEQVVDTGDLGPRSRRQLMREALSILGRQPGLVEAVEGGLAGTMADPRSARMLQAGTDAMTHFLGGSRDFLAAVLTAMEVWSRPTGATGSGVVAAMLVQAWPDEEQALELCTIVAQDRGGAVLGATDGIAMLFPGVGRAVIAAQELLPQLPPAARIGLDAAEAATETQAVRAVGAARALCHGARPGEILCSAVVRALAAGVPGEFTLSGNARPDGLPIYSLAPPSAPPDEPDAQVSPAEPSQAE